MLQRTVPTIFAILLLAVPVQAKPASLQVTLFGIGSETTQEQILKQFGTNPAKGIDPILSLATLTYGTDGEVEIALNANGVVSSVTLMERGLGKDGARATGNRLHALGFDDPVVQYLGDTYDELEAAVGPPPNDGFWSQSTEYEYIYPVGDGSAEWTFEFDDDGTVFRIALSFYPQPELEIPSDPGQPIQGTHTAQLLGETATFKFTEKMTLCGISPSMPYGAFIKRMGAPSYQQEIDKGLLIKAWAMGDSHGVLYIYHMDPGTAATGAPELDELPIVMLGILANEVPEADRPAFVANLLKQHADEPWLGMLFKTRSEVLASFSWPAVMRGLSLDLSYKTPAGPTMTIEYTFDEPAAGVEPRVTGIGLLWQRD